MNNNSNNNDQNITTNRHHNVTSTTTPFPQSSSVMSSGMTGNSNGSGGSVGIHPSPPLKSTTTTTTAAINSSSNVKRMPTQPTTQQMIQPPIISPQQASSLYNMNAAYAAQQQFSNMAGMPMYHPTNPVLHHPNMYQMNATMTPQQKQWASYQRQMQQQMMSANYSQMMMAAATQPNLVHAGHAGHVGAVVPGTKSNAVIAPPVVGAPPRGKMVAPPVVAPPRIPHYQQNDHLLNNNVNAVTNNNNNNSSSNIQKSKMSSTNGFQPTQAEKRQSNQIKRIVPNKPDYSVSYWLDTALLGPLVPKRVALYSIFESDHPYSTPFRDLDAFADAPGSITPLPTQVVKHEKKATVKTVTNNSSQSNNKKQKQSPNSASVKQENSSPKKSEPAGELPTVFSSTTEDLAFGDLMSLDSGGLSDIDFILPPNSSVLGDNIFEKGENEDEEEEEDDAHNDDDEDEASDQDDILGDDGPMTLSQAAAKSLATTQSAGPKTEDDDYSLSSSSDTEKANSQNKRQRGSVTYTDSPNGDDEDEYVFDQENDDPHDDDFHFDSEDDNFIEPDDDSDSDYEISPKRKKAAPKKRAKAVNPSGKKLGRGKSNMVDHNILDYVGNNRKKSYNNPESDEDDSWLPASERRKSSNKTREVSRSSSRTTYDQFFSDSEQEEEVQPQEKPLFEEIEEDIIEKVCDSRKRAILPDGTLGDVLEDDSELEPGQYVEEYLIHWKGWAHIHSTWGTFDILKGQKGFKKLENYIKKKKQFEQWKAIANPEEIEQQNVYEEMERQMLGKWVQVDRVIAHKETSQLDPHAAQSQYEYLVKWKYLPYSECTWEYSETISHFPHEIEEYWKLQDRMGYEYPSITSDTLRFTKFTEQPSWFTGGSMREYQLEGVNWLHYSWCTRTNVILADEMGLGKTLQTITFLNFLYHEKKISGPFLVVVPLSVLAGWMKEFKKWAPELYVVPYIGDSRSREIIRTFDMFHDTKAGKKLKFNVLLTTFEQIRKDAEFLGKISWSYLAVDEAHVLKNDKSKLYEVLIKFQTYGRLLITGTPLQNTLKELWCLLHFLMPEKFTSMDVFERHYSELHSQDRLSELHEELAPHLLRRLKADVEKSLPNKIERILRVGLSDTQKQYYKWILSRNFHELSKCGSQASLLNVVVELKKCCNHPFLFDGAREQALDSEEYANEIAALIRTSGKMILLDKLLVRLKETGHRVLIFSQMVKVLDVLGRYLSLKGFKFQRLDGSTSSRERQHSVDHFNAPNSEDFCFLLSTRAGGLGINLATADTVIIFDSDWNPQNDLQAEARAHRIGQTKVVNIYRLVTSNSVEEKILESAKQKMILDHLVIQKMDTSGRTIIDQSNSKKGYSQFSKQELAEVLRFGAENLFKKESDDQEREGQGSIKELTDMDIDDILARAETTNKTELEAEQAVEAEKSKSLMSAFKVANFAIIDPATVKPPKPANMTKEEQEKAGSFWKELISEETVHDPLYLPERKSRNRKQVVASYSPSGDGDYDPDHVGDEDYSDEEYGGGKKKKANKNRVGGFNIPETRAFIKALKKFPDRSRIKDILEDAELVGKKHEKDITIFMESLLKACQDAIHPPIDPKTKKAAKIPANIDFNGVKIDPFEIVQRMDEIDALKKKIDEYDDPSQFRKQINAKTVRNWPVKWDLTDDANLLRGILKHGIGSWSLIRMDEELHLTDKIVASNEDEGKDKKRVKPMQLGRRIDSLLGSILDEVRKEEEKRAKKKKSSTSSKSKTKAESSTTSSNKKVKESGKKKRKSDESDREDSMPEKPVTKKTRGSASKTSSTNRSASPPPATQKRRSTRNSSSVKVVDDSEIFDLCESHFEPVTTSLENIANLTEDDDPKYRLQVIKAGLLIIGEHIEQTIANKGEHDEAISNATTEQLTRVMWEYVHNRTHTSGDSNTLQKLYHRLASQKPKLEEEKTSRSKKMSANKNKESTRKNTSSSRSSSRKTESPAANTVSDANRNSRRSTRQMVNYQEDGSDTGDHDVNDEDADGGWKKKARSKKASSSSTKSSGSKASSSSSTKTKATTKKRKYESDEDEPTPKRRKK